MNIRKLSATIILASSLTMAGLTGCTPVDASDAPQRAISTTQLVTDRVEQERTQVNNAPTYSPENTPTPMNLDNVFWYTLTTHRDSNPKFGLGTKSQMIDLAHTACDAMQNEKDYGTSYDEALQAYGVTVVSSNQLGWGFEEAGFFWGASAAAYCKDLAYGW